MMENPQTAFSQDVLTEYVYIVVRQRITDNQTSRTGHFYPCRKGILAHGAHGKVVTRLASKGD
jgi:hypothetical protein